MFKFLRQGIKAVALKVLMMDSVLGLHKMEEELEKEIDAASTEERHLREIGKDKEADELHHMIDEMEAAKSAEREAETAQKEVALLVAEEAAAEAEGEAASEAASKPAKQRATASPLALTLCLHDVS